MYTYLFNGDDYSTAKTKFMKGPKRAELLRRPNLVEYN